MKITLFVLGVLVMMSSVYADNAIRNSSFELDRAEYGIHRYIRPGRETENKFIEPVFDPVEKVHGKQSIRFDNMNADAIELVSREYQLDPRKQYTFSFYMKSNKPITVRAGQFAGKFIDERRSDWTLFTMQYFSIKTEWTRYHFSFNIKDDRGWYFTQFRWGNINGAENDATVWIDAIQVNEGNEPVDYTPLANVEAALVGDKRVILPEKPISCSMDVINYTSSELDFSSTLQTEDTVFPDKKFKTQTFHSSIPGGGRLSIPVEATGGQFGHFCLKGTYSTADMTASLGPCFFAEIPATDQSAYDLKKEFTVGINTSLERSGHRTIDQIKDSFRTMNGTNKEMFGQFIHQTGVKLVRIHEGGLSWKDIEPESGVYNWTVADETVDFMNRHHLNIMPVLGNMFYLRDDPATNQKRVKSSLPKWLLDSPKTIRHPMKGKWDGISPDPEAWQRFVSAVASRYKGKIPAYEITNEPNIALPSANEYIPYLQSSTRIIRQLDPAALIVGGSVTTDFGGKQSKFLSDLIHSGSIDNCDAISFHPYDSPLSFSRVSAQSSIQELKDLCRQSESDVALWNTELYYIGPPPTALNTHAHHLLRRLLIDCGENIKTSMTINCGQLIQNELAPHWQLGTEWAANGYVPHDLYVGISVGASLLNGTSPVMRFNWPKHTCGYIYLRKDGEQFAAVWCREDSPAYTMSMPEGEYRCYDMFMNPIGKTQSVKLCPYPVFIFGHDLDKCVLKTDKPIQIEKSFITYDRNTAVLNMQVLNIAAKPVIASIRPEFCENSQNVNLAINEKGIAAFPLPIGYDLQKTVIIVSVDGGDYSIPLRHLFRKTIRDGETFFDDKFSFSTTADSENWCLTIDVHDSVVGNRIDGQPWNGDSIELFFDSSPLENMDNTSYGKTNSRVFIAPKSANGLTEFKSAWSINVKNLDIQIDKNKDGYQAKVSIPWKVLGIQYGQPLGFDIKVNDNDGGSENTSSIWSGNENNRYRDRYGLWFPVFSE